MASNYWSSTTNANNTDNAWNMNFNNGNNNNKSNNNHVRAVRGGECSLLSFRSVYRAYLDCRKRKRGTVNALRFEVDLLENLFTLALELQNHRYRPSRSVCFITRSPKLREIFAADFRDRIVHHLAVRELETLWDPRFIHDSYACRKGKGIQGAVKRLQGFMRKATRNGKRAAWFLQLDIRSFFMSIDKHVLFRSFAEDRHCPPELLNLLSILIFHDPTTDYTFKGDRSLLAHVPSHKSLFGVGPGRGLPIGNLTSQFFANVYLNELDQFVKHRLKCRFYLRYVDDFILVSESEEELVSWRHRIERFLDDRLRLRLKEAGRARRVSEGANFLGYIVRPRYILARNRVVHNLKYRVAQYRAKMAPERSGSGGEQTRPDAKALPRRMVVHPYSAVDLQQILASYLGHFRHADCRGLVRSLWINNPWLLHVFRLTVRNRLAPKAAPRKPFKTLRAQVTFFRRAYPGRVLLFKMGTFVELYGADARLANRIRRFALHPGHRGMDMAVGFPARMAPGMRNLFLSRGLKTVMIDEGPVGGAVRQRYARELMWPASATTQGEAT